MASPKRRADRRAEVFEQHLTGSADASDLKLVRPKTLLMVTSLRRTRFSYTRVLEIVEVVRQVELDAGKEELKEPPARRVAQREGSAFRDYAEREFAEAEEEGRLPVFSSTVCAGKVDAAEKKGFLALLDLPLSWAVATLPRNRHLQTKTGKATEDVLFAEVQLPGAEMERSPPFTSWLEVVPSSDTACKSTDAPEVDASSLDAILSGLWPQTNFRGIRSLWNVVNDRFLGIGFADVERFLRKQELRQMVQPRIAAVSTPLVATELGWHQVDIMYATWVKGAQTDLDKALEQNAEKDPGKLIEDEEAQLVAIGDDLQREEKKAGDERGSIRKRTEQLQVEERLQKTRRNPQRLAEVVRELAELNARSRVLESEGKERDAKKTETYLRIDQLRKDKRDRKKELEGKNEEESSEYDSDTNYISEEEDGAAAPAKGRPRKVGIARGAGGRPYKYILNVMDIFSKYAWSFPLRDMSAETVAKELEGLWLREGAPKKLQSDGGFRSYAIDHLARRFGVELATCAPYHSQCSGAIERLNRTVRESVKRLRHAYTQTKDWASFLPTILSSYNAQKHTTTQLSPFLLQRGHEPRALRAVFYDPKQSKPINPRLAVYPQAIFAANEQEAEAARDSINQCLADAVGELEGGADTPSAVQDAVAQTAARALARIGPLESELKTAQADMAANETYLKNYAVSRDMRNAFAAQGIRHGALAMTTDALIRAEKSMEALEPGTLVRISFEHTNKKQRAEIKVGLKRAEDRHTWGSAIYCVTDKPLVQLWLGSGKEGAESPSSQRCALDVKADTARYGNVYTVFPCLPSQLSEDEQGARFVPRQDLLKISDSLLDGRLVKDLKTRFSEPKMRQAIQARVTLRDQIPAPSSFL